MDKNKIFLFQLAFCFVLVSVGASLGFLAHPQWFLGSMEYQNKGIDDSQSGELVPITGFGGFINPNLYDYVPRSSI